MLNVSIDIGNSQTKCFYRKGDDYKKLRLSNAYYFTTDPKTLMLADSNSVVGQNVEIEVPELSDDGAIEINRIEYVLNNESNSNKELVELIGLNETTTKMCIIGGEKAELQYRDLLERPLLVDKASQRVSYIAILSALNTIANISGETRFNIVVTLPFAETDPDTFKKVVSILKGSHILSGDFGRREIIIDYVLVLGECFASAISYHFNLSGSIKKDINPALNGLYILINMGAGTTDVAMFENGKFVENSKDTLNIAGNTMREKLIVAFNEKYKVKPKIKDAENALKTGYMAVGAKKIDVYDMICKVKYEASLQLMEEIKKYCIGHSVDIKTLSAVVCTGGGVLSSTVQMERDGNIVELTIPSNVHYVKEFFKEYAPFTEVISSDTYKGKSFEHPRWDDAIGAYIVLLGTLKRSGKDS